MKSTVIVSTVAIMCLFLLITPSAGSAQDLTQTFRADSTMDGHAGSLFRILESGYPGEDIFIFEETGMYRVYAAREDGGTWEYFTPAQYFCPVSSMTVGQTWRAINWGMAQETLATVVLEEDITVAAGTFTCFKIEIQVVSNPDVVVQTNWISDGGGLIRESFFEGTGYWISELLSSSVTGTGFMPRVVGNWWSYSGFEVSTEESSWGAIKKEVR